MTPSRERPFPGAGRAPQGPRPAGADVQGHEGRHHGRRRRRHGKRPPDPAEVVARVEPVIQRANPEPTPPPAEAPLSREEVLQMKQHLAFLREHRKVLQLKVNAQEDLLLNGQREPTRRGLCQHLLSKIDRTRVVAAAQRLEPLAATRLVEGVLRIAPDLDYVLLYLECVQRSSSQKQATAALMRGLELIDFSQVSKSQMRRVLDLIVHVFDAAEYPALLLGLLEGESFRTKFDESVSLLPDVLAALVVPLRAAQAAVLHGRPNPYGTHALAAGVRLLLDSSEQALLERPLPVRRRLIECALATRVAADPAVRKTIDALLNAFSGDAHVHGDLGLELARVLLAEGRDPEAVRVLEGLTRKHPDFQLPKRWLEAARAPRVGRVALLGDDARGAAPPGVAAPGSGSREGERRRRRGLWLDGMRSVWVERAQGTAPGLYSLSLELRRGLCLPGVALVVVSGGADGEAFYAVPSMGSSFEHALTRKGGLEREAALSCCAEATALLAGLAVGGLRLPDAAPARFELAPNGRLWLSDLWGLERDQPAWAEKKHLEHARGLCRAVLEHARRYVVPPGLAESIDRAESMSELARLFA